MKLLTGLPAKLAFILPLAMAAMMPAACATHEVAEPDMAAVKKLEAQDRMFDAMEMLKSMAKKGDAEAQYELGGFYHYGYVGANDYTKASAWYLRAAHQGNTDAMIGLAALYGTKAAGKYGNDIDHMSAFTWLAIAAGREKDPNALAKITGLRDQLKSGLTDEMLSEALAAVQAFQPVPETPAN